MKPRWLAFAAVVLAAVPAAGQSNILNARLVERPAGELAETFRQISSETGPMWIGYAVPAQSSGWNACCWDHHAAATSDCGRCALEERSDASGTTVKGSGKERVRLEGGASVVVLYRVGNGRVEKIRVFSDSCQIDAGGRTVYWITGVNPVASVSLLKGLAQSLETRDGSESSPRRLSSEALVALSAHGASEAVTSLIDLARKGSSGRLRGDALFWLAQRAGRKAAGTISDAIASDPDTKVKERAVFALSQLPADDGVPKLIEVARTNRNPRVRQQAVFWLGQSKDPRALAFFEEILLK